MKKGKRDGMRMRGQDEEIRTTEDGVQTEGGDVDAPDERPDTGPGSGAPSQPPHLRGAEVRGKGQGFGAGEEVEWEDLTAITNELILAKKAEIDQLQEQLKAEFATLRGMLLIDSGGGRINVDLDRMMYQVPKDDLA